MALMITTQCINCDCVRAGVPERSDQRGRGDLPDRPGGAAPSAWATSTSRSAGSSARWIAYRWIPGTMKTPAELLAKYKRLTGTESGP
jgi:hypothetical protein